MRAFSDTAKLPGTISAQWQARGILQRQTWHFSGQPEPGWAGRGITQFGRAMQALDIQILCANTPQAKGRVERANQTLQDRLVKELRLAGISDPSPPMPTWSFAWTSISASRWPLAALTTRIALCWQRQPGSYPQPPGDPHLVQEPDLAVLPGVLPDPADRPSLCPEQGHRDRVPIRQRRS